MTRIAPICFLFEYKHMWGGDWHTKSRLCQKLFTLARPAYSSSCTRRYGHHSLHAEFATLITFVCMVLTATLKLRDVIIISFKCFKCTWKALRWKSARSARIFECGICLAPVIFNRTVNGKWSNQMSITHLLGRSSTNQDTCTNTHTQVASIASSTKRHENT